MSENVFFNPGQSISSSYDFDKAYTAAKIYHKKADNPALIVQEKMVNLMLSLMKLRLYNKKQLKARSIL